MNEVKPFGQRGLSLVYVLVVITVLSTVVIHQEYVRFLDRQRNAFEFTVAQTQNILNLANAYRLDNGEWPQDHRGDCVPIESSDFLPQFDTVTNGWGFAIGASGDCERRDASYTVSQIVPSEYYARFQSFFADNVSGRSAGSGYMRMEISVGLASLGENQLLTMERFDDPSVVTDSAYFNHAGCDPGQNEMNIIGLDAMCAYINVGHGGAAPIIDGFVVDIYSLNRVGYKTLIDNFNHHDHHDVWNPNALYYSDFRCPVTDNSRKIKAAMLSWCE